MTEFEIQSPSGLHHGHSPGQRLAASDVSALRFLM